MTDAATPAAPATARTQFRAELYQLALVHWTLLLLVAGHVALIAIRMVDVLNDDNVLAIVAVSMAIALAVTTLRLARWLNVNAVAYAIGMLVPVVNVFVVAMLAQLSIAAFRREGVGIRWIGPDLDDAKRASRSAA